MSKRPFFFYLLPFLLILALLSLPEVKNTALRNKIAEKLLFVSRFISANKEKKQPVQLEKWFQRQKIALENVEWQASKLAPFTLTTSTINACDYITATVLFRNINSWNSSLWINKGFEDSALIAKNSPVLSGDSVVGIIDYVGKHASCVRLITDSSVTPAVRVVRKADDHLLTFSFSVLVKAIEEKRLTFKSDEEQKGMLWLLNKLKDEHPSVQTPEFYAKGVLQGHGEPLWSAQTILLKGFGFNYDYKDQHGPARDLRTGEPIDPDQQYAKTKAAPIIQAGDLLLTSGMDGIFPEGLKIATVHTIQPLSEGAYAYEILAEPTAADLLDLQHVTILPPQDIDIEHLPDRLERIIDQLQ